MDIIRSSTTIIYVLSGHDPSKHYRTRTKTTLIHQKATYSNPVSANVQPTCVINPAISMIKRNTSMRFRENSKFCAKNNEKSKYLAVFSKVIRKFLNSFSSSVLGKIHDHPPFKNYTVNSVHHKPEIVFKESRSIHFRSKLKKFRSNPLKTCKFVDYFRINPSKNSPNRAPCRRRLWIGLNQNTTAADEETEPPLTR